MPDTSNLKTNIQNFFSNGKGEKRIQTAQENIVIDQSSTELYIPYKTKFYIKCIIPFNFGSVEYSNFGFKFE